MSILSSIGKLATTVAPIAGMVPGVGWGVGAALGLGGAAAGAIAGRKKSASGPSGEEATYANRFEESVAKGGAQADEDMGWYRDKAKGFDASESLEQANQGAFDQFKVDFTENMTALRGTQVGRGRSRTGFADRDEDELFTRMGENLNSKIIGNAMNAAQMQQNNVHQYGAVASRGQDRYTDAVTGRLNTLEAARQEEAASKREGRAGLVGGILSAAGALGGAYLSRPRAPKVAS